MFSFVHFVVLFVASSIFHLYSLLFISSILLPKVYSIPLWPFRFYAVNGCEPFKSWNDHTPLFDADESVTIPWGDCETEELSRVYCYLLLDTIRYDIPVTVEKKRDLVVGMYRRSTASKSNASNSPFTINYDVPIVIIVIIVFCNFLCVNANTRNE